MLVKGKRKEKKIDLPINTITTPMPTFPLLPLIISGKKTTEKKKKKDKRGCIISLASRSIRSLVTESDWVSQLSVKGCRLAFLNRWVVTLTGVEDTHSALAEWGYFFRFVARPSPYCSGAKKKEKKNEIHIKTGR